MVSCKRFIFWLQVSPCKKTWKQFICSFNTNLHRINFFIQLSSYFVHGEGYNNQQIIFWHIWATKKTDKKFILVAKVSLFLICINKEFIL